MTSPAGGSGAAARRGAQSAKRAADGPWLKRLARVGFAVNGLLHVLIGGIALQLAFGGGSGETADQSGALGAIAEQPFGRVVLWVGVVGFLALAIWNLSQAATGVPGVSGGSGGSGRDDSGEVKERVVSGAKAIVYLVLTWTVLSFARGGSTSSGGSTSDLTATLLEAPAGRVLVAVVGAAVVGVGGYQVHKGVTKKFLEDLRGGTSGSLGQAVVRLGQAGYVGRGVAFGVVGVLFVVAAVREQPEEATGLDGALTTLRDQPFGAVLLTLVALGFVAFGLYSVARARYADL